MSTVVHAYNVCEHDTTHFSQYFLMFWRNARLPVDLALGLDPQWPGAKDKTKFIKDLRERLCEAYKHAASNMAKHSQSNKMRYNKCAKAPVLEEGDTVLIKNVHLRGKDKLANRWGDDIYVVLKKIDNSHVYRVKREGSDDPPRSLHRNLLLPYSKLAVQEKPSTPKEEILPPKPQRSKRPNTRSRTIITPINNDSESDNEERYVFPVPRSDAMSNCERIKGGETECGDSSSQEEIHTVVPDEVSEPPSTSDEVERIKCDGESFSKLSREITDDIVACAISGDGCTVGPSAMTDICKAFQKYRCSSAVKERWDRFLNDQNVCAKDLMKCALLQYVLRRMLHDVISSSDNDQPLEESSHNYMTKEEEGVLRLVAGYVPIALVKRYIMQR